MEIIMGIKMENILMKLHHTLTTLKELTSSTLDIDMYVHSFRAILDKFYLVNYLKLFYANPVKKKITDKNRKNAREGL